MRNYIQLQLLMEKIELPAKGRQAINQYVMSDADYENWKRLFFSATDNFFSILDKEPEKEKLVLYLYVNFAADIYVEFVKRGFSDKVYYDTFKDFSIWFKKCEAKKAVCGLMEERWLALPLKLKVFRLGRLQFEPEILAKNKEVNKLKIPSGTGVLHVHIPEGEPLTDELCEESFALADTFFSDRYTVYDCWSWLLSPKLYEVLDENSNILKFQRRFTVHKVYYEFRMAEERIFGFIAEDPRLYIDEDTSLQRNVKAYVSDGKDLGIGYGVLYRSHLSIGKRI